MVQLSIRLNGRERTRSRSVNWEGNHVSSLLHNSPLFIGYESFKAVEYITDMNITESMNSAWLYFHFFELNKDPRI